MTLFQFLEKKPLYYDEIDYNRMPNAYKSIKDKLKLPKIIQIVGTNGKGSTGRFIADMLRTQNISVGHYTSPHIIKFNERIWINGKDVDDKVLEFAHVQLQTILSNDFVATLSYFEYTTLLAILIFSKSCEFIVLEAGLGGEYDATSVFPKVLSVITPIGLDHEDFLGKNIREIAITKLNSITKKAVISKQYESEVYEIAKEICKKKDAELFICEDLIKFDTIKNINDIITKKNLPMFQKINLETASCAVSLLGYEPNFSNITLMQGRSQKIDKNITIDVGHNIMAAKAIATSFKGKKITLIYNSFKDKQYEKVLDILLPIVKKVEILLLENKREMATNEILQICKNSAIKVSNFTKIDKNNDYLVFGSFVVVEKFLELYEKH
ncbi:MAG: bifunctional folylpolyglutamate synthase/dihydrofolate synthase [Epsilonproteobacteria bacterium]|nr:bifunctional folylpolyglutamate synthase/dihydrofolate synthase [Campylobacterota bacterium]